MLFQKVLADSAQIVEDAQSQCQKGHIIKVNTQVVAYIDQKCCQQSIGKEAGDKNPVIKGALAGCPDTAKYRVKGGQQGNGKQLGVRHRNTPREKKAQHDAQAQAHDC